MSEFKDILLPLSTYPDPTPEHAIDWAVRFAAICGGQISTLVSVLDRKKLAKSYSHRSWLMDVPALIDSAIATSGQNGRRLMDKFERTARERGVLRDEQYEHSSMFSSLDYVVQCARLRDLVVAPVPDYIGLDELLIEDLVFGTGRPTVLLPAYEGAPTPDTSIDRIAVAWDFSRAATRTMADALPLLQKAKKVFLFTVRGEKDIASTCSLNDVDRHLQTHGILAEIEDIPADGRPIGVVMREYISHRKADMLVMGAFGHSRLREFVLGGASRDIIDRPPLPVFMSH